MLDFNKLYQPIDRSMLTCTHAYALNPCSLSSNSIYLAEADPAAVKALVDKYLLVPANAGSGSASSKARHGHRRPNFQVVVDIHEVAGVLKRFLGDLDEPLATFGEYASFTFIARGHAKPEEQNREICEALTKVPVTYFHTLREVVDHLTRVANKGRENNVRTEDLAAKFAPFFFRSPEGRPGDERDKEVQITATQMLMMLPVEYWDTAEKQVTIGAFYTSSSPVPMKQHLKRAKSSSKILKSLE